MKREIQSLRIYKENKNFAPPFTDVHHPEVIAGFSDDKGNHFLSAPLRRWIELLKSAANTIYFVGNLQIRFFSYIIVVRIYS